MIYLKHSYINPLKICKANIMAMSLENRPLAAVTPPVIYYLDCYNKMGCKCRMHGHNAPGDHWERWSRSQPYIGHFFCRRVGVGGYNAARGLISRDITLTIEKRRLKFRKYVYSIYFFTNMTGEKMYYVKFNSVWNINDTKRLPTT